jgi:hypothetical protein
MLIEPLKLKPDNHDDQQSGGNGQRGMEKTQHFKTFSSSSFEKSAEILAVLNLFRSSCGASSPNNRYLVM